MVEACLAPNGTESKVTEMDTRLGSAEVAFGRLREMARDVGPAEIEAVSQAQKTPSSVGAAANEIEIVSNLLEAAKMACGDLPSKAIAPLRTLLTVIKTLYATAPGLERDIRDLIEAASMACVDLPSRESGALRTLLRVASGKLGEAGRIKARNDADAVVGLPEGALRRAFD